MTEALQRAAAMLLGLVAPRSDAPALPDAPPPSPPTPAEIELHWEAPAECPSAQSIEARYRSMLTAPPAGEGLMRVDASVTATAAGYSLALTTEYYGRVERRVLDASRCDELGEATAIVIAVSLEPAAPVGPSVPAGRGVPNEPGVPSEPGVPTGPGVPSGPGVPAGTGVPSEPGMPSEPSDAVDGLEIVSPSGPAPMAEPAPRQDRTPRPRARPRAAMRVATGLERGVVPRLTTNQELSLGLHWPRVRLELTGRFVGPRRMQGPAEASARILLGAVGLHGCARPRPGPVELPVCVGFEGGVMRADSRGLDPADRIFGPWGGPSVSAGIAHHWSRMGLWASGMLVGRVWGTRTLLGDEAAFEPAPVSLRASAGIEVLFGAGQP